MINQKKFRPILNDIATRSFRDVADNDYITARLCYINRLYPQYIWYSQQSVEKYLKAILLFNMQSTRKLRHNLEKSYERITELIPKLGMELSDTTVKYIQHLDTWGENRYFEKAHFISPCNRLDKLDEAVWEIRRYCKYFNKNYESYKLELEQAQKATLDQKVQFITNGILEKIINNDNHIHHSILLTCNRHFGDFSEEVHTPLHAINPTQTLHPEYFEELNKYIQFPKEVVDAYKEINSNADL